MVSHAQIPWQVFAQNGEPISGDYLLPSEFDGRPDAIRSTAHVWIWRSNELKDTTEVLLQQRAPGVTSAGKYDISAAGHVDRGETPLRAAVREAKEELGLNVDAQSLVLWFSRRLYRLDKNSFQNVYLYQSADTQEFVFDVNEVSAVEWVAVADLERFYAEPDKYNIVPKDDIYVQGLLDGLNRLPELLRKHENNRS